jgi:hypothetical protein
MSVAVISAMIRFLPEKFSGGKLIRYSIIWIYYIHFPDMHKRELRQGTLPAACFSQGNMQQKNKSAQ